jgi:glycosyltransferase involved in cell wall biosynthesis
VNAIKVWVLSPFSDPSSSESADRYRYICQELTDRGALVCQFVSAFDHAQKRHRTISSLPWRCIPVFEPGYKRNVSISRIMSHALFDLFIIFYLLKEIVIYDVPDVIYCALPHNGAASIAGFLAKTFRVRFIVDIHDTWPESMLGLTRLNAWTRVPYQAWKLLANIAIWLADDVFGESKRYVERANQVRDHGSRSRGCVVYLGGDISYYSGIEPIKLLPIELEGAGYIVAYVGTLGANYDLDCIIDAFVLFARDYPSSALLFLGAGERESVLRSRIAGLGLRAWVSGRIPHRQLVAYLKLAKVGLNSFISGGNVAYSYKLNDYLLSGVPVINSLEGEAAELISEHRLGENYISGDSNDLAEALRRAYRQWQFDSEWGDRVSSFAAEVLDRKKGYLPIISSCLRVVIES